jgi:hypothetical protein
MVTDFSTVNASENGTQSVEQNKKKKKKSSKKKTYKKKTSSSLSSFGQAYREARKKGLKTFKHNGKTYTTEKDTEKKSVTSNNKKTNRESASYKNVSFGSAYKDAKRKGISTFSWNGKKYTTDSKSKTNKKTYKKTSKKNNKKYTTKKRTSKKKYSTKKKTSKKRNTTKKKSSNTYKKSSTNTYTPPPSYNNDNSGREYKRESNNNTPVKKEPKKDN